jgi:hypothetical protein
VGCAADLVDHGHRAVQTVVAIDRIFFPWSAGIDNPAL